MKTLNTSYSCVNLVKRSRFLVKAAPANSISEADDFFYSNKNSIATHNCWAYRINDSYRFFDDKEPHGTAGRQILQAIDEFKLNRIAVLVTRWFGGVKLGKGGLMRAYKDSVIECLSQSNFIDIIDISLIKCIVPAQYMHIVYRLDNTIGIVSNNFNGDDYEFIIKVQEDKISYLRNMIYKFSRGNALLYRLDSAKINESIAI